MRNLMLCSVLSVIGLFACVESREPSQEADPALAAETATERQPASDELPGAAPEPDTLYSCCIDYTCPSPDFSTTGCKTGAGPSIREAFDTCNAYCSVTCASSGLYCDEGTDARAGAADATGGAEAEPIDQ